MSDCITAVLLDEPPVIVSPALNVPLTLDITTTPCEIVGGVLYEVTLTGVVPFDWNNWKVFVVEFFTVKTPGV